MEKGNDKKLGWLDSTNLKAVKRLKKNEGSWKEPFSMGNYNWKGYKARANGDYKTAEKEASKTIDRKYKTLLPAIVVPSMVAGAVMAGKGNRFAGAGMMGASMGSLVSASYLGDKFGNKTGHKAAKKIDEKVSKKILQQRRDEVKVAEGTMSESDFIKKYGK